MITKIRKRDGSVVLFQKDKIAEAIWKSVKAVGGTDHDKANHLADFVVEQLEQRYSEGGIPGVEEIQDLAEKTLIEKGHAKTAKAFILYRQSHEELRNVKGLFDTIESVDDYLSLNDWMVKENSNMGFSLQGLNNYIANKIISNYWVRRIYPEAIRNAHETGEIHIHDLGTLGAYCFDSKTKILTETGWKLFKDVKTGERVATKNLKTGKLEFQVPYDKQAYNYNGEMYSFEGRSVSLLVTPEHRLLVRRKHKKDWEFVNPSEFKYGMEFDKKIDWEGHRVEHYKIPFIAGGNRKKEMGSFKIKEYLELMGWYISEGSAYIPSDGDYRISIAQSYKKYREEICNILDKMKLSYNNTSKFNIHLHSKELYYHLKQLGISKEKYIPGYIKELDSDLIKIFLIALFKGDGSFSSKGGLRKYYTNSEKLAEDVVECLLKIGLCGTISERKNRKGYIISVETKHLTPIYRRQVMKANYNGKVYDFSVKNGTLVVMREGKVVVSGNCVGWDLKDLIMTGFKGVAGKVESKPPKHLRTALGQIVNFFYTLQGETAGAQAFSNFDTLLAPYVRYDGLDYHTLKQAMQEFLFNLAVPTRVGFQCMSEDTEILTIDGWANYDSLKQGDMIKTFNVEKKIIEDKPIKKLFKKEYEGIMYNLKNRIQDQLISPHHRVVRKKFQTNDYILEEIEEVLKMKSPFIIPIAGENQKKDSNISDEEIKIMAWIIGEGTIENYTSHRHSSRITIYQSAIKNPLKYKEIISLLKKFELNYSERDSCPALGNSVKMIRLNAESSRKIHQMFNSRESVNFIPKKLLSMSKRQSRLFLEVYLKADGFENCKIATTNKNILDGLQQIAVNAEYGFTVLTRNPTIGKKLIYVLRLIDHKETYIQEVKKINYKGIIWCPNTDNETVIARRNGKVFITGNTPFTNITMDLKVPDYMKNEHITIGGEFKKETYGEFQKEMDMINRAFAEGMIEGDASGRVFTFPIPTYNITKDFDWDNPNHNVIWEMTAKYGIPYFSNFINSDMKPEDARSMCCRLRLDQSELRKRGGGLFGSNPQTGSIGVVTINMPRIGFTAVSEDDFFKKLRNLMELSKESLEIKRKSLERFTELGLYPYTKFYLRNIHARFGEYWKNHFSTIGLLGMNEAIMNFMPGENITTEKGRKFAEKTLLFMMERLEEYQKETNSIYNLEATPGEGTTYRFARKDKKQFGRILVANEEAACGGRAPYYTNSTQLPVNYTNDLFKALELQDSLQILYTGGTVFHGFIGEKMQKEHVKLLVKKIAENFSLPYFTITPTFSICPVHGYLAGDHEYCPKCDEEMGYESEELEKANRAQIIVEAIHGEKAGKVIEDTHSSEISNYSIDEQVNNQR